MISVIICSNNPSLLNEVQLNIKQSIGVAYEILCFDNRESKTGICKVYNDLAVKAFFPILCFVHEDALFETKNWGNKILKIFEEDSAVNLVGVAGCKYKSAYFSGWFSSVEELDCANYIHQYVDHKESVHLSPLNDNALQEVVCIDGVFMCVKKEAWQKRNFNEQLLTGFHFYDIDFSLQMATLGKVVVTYEIQLIHITSGGDYGNKWVEIAMKYHEQMKNYLPYSKVKVDRYTVDKKVIETALDFLKNYPISFQNKIMWVYLQKLYLLPALYYSIVKFFIYKPLRLNYIHKLFKSK